MRRLLSFYVSLMVEEEEAVRLDPSALILDLERSIRELCGAEGVAGDLVESQRRYSLVLEVEEAGIDLGELEDTILEVSRNYAPCAQIRIGGVDVIGEMD